MKKNNKGFSLAELIVVVLILGILAVAITPQVMNWIDKSKVAKDKSYAGTVAVAAESVALEYIGLGQHTQIADLTLDENGIAKTGDHSAHTVAALTHDTTNATTIAATFCFYCDVEYMIGTDKCEKPEQANMNDYVIDFTLSGDNKTVTVDVEPTP